jgi:hypothetical protein
MQKKLHPYLPTTYKNQLSVNQTLKFKTWICELLEENIGEALQVIGLGKEFLDMASNSKGNKSKNWQMRLYKTKSLLYNKGNNQQTELTIYQNGRKYWQTIHLTRSNFQNM